MSGTRRTSSRAKAQTIFYTEATEADGLGGESGSEASDAEMDEEEEEEEPVRRKSSRSTKFRACLKDAPDGISDLLRAVPDEKRTAPSPNLPAKRHAKRRMSKAHAASESDFSDEGSDSEDDEEGDGDVYYEDDEEEEEEMKINKVIACKSLRIREWKDTCKNMNTTEITNGSRWIQDDDDDGVDLDKFEERFLVKWDQLSFLHVSWETQRDLEEFCDGAKVRLKTFFRKAEGGLLYEQDERLDGDYFDPSWVTVDRILEISEDEDVPEIVMDPKDPNFEEGTGRQFYIKWVNKGYDESTYEFERDLILNEVEYKEAVSSYEKRSAKPSRQNISTFKKQRDTEKKKLYKIFGDRVNMTEDEKEKIVKEYQDSLQATKWENGGQLRDYQAEGVSWMISNHINGRSSILADEMGLGKTIQTATYVATVSKTLKTRGPFLIVAPLSTLPHWYREFTGWTTLNTVVYHGLADDRNRAREDEFAFPSDRVDAVGMNQYYLQKVARQWRADWQKQWMVEVVITTPEIMIASDWPELKAIEWEIIVVDEAHRLKNHQSKLAQNLRDERFVFNHALLLTGTPIQNNMQELWTLLNFVEPDTFDSLSDFLDDYGDIKSKEKVDELHESIRPFILRRLKEDVEKSVPPKEETLIEVELTVLQKQYYRALYEKNLKFLHKNKKAIDGPSLNNLAMQLRKCCNHPFLLTGVEQEVRQQNPSADVTQSLVNASGKLVLLDKLLPRLKADGHRVLIFSQFKIMLDIIEDYLGGRGFKAERIDGSITGLKRQAAIDRFQAKDSGNREQPFIMLLSTRAGGVGINLTAADTCIIFDSDWNPQNDLQAQVSRCELIRIPATDLRAAATQTKNVKIYRLLTRKTYEMQMFHMSSLKMGLDQAVLQGIENSSDKGVMSKEEVEKLLKHGAYDIFKEDESGEGDKESNDFESQDIDSILARRAKTVVHDNTGSGSTAAGGTFSKASFKATNSDGVDAAGVDVDDPDFWTKVVGEAKEEEAEELGKRKRAQNNYSEKLYSQQIDAAIRGDGGAAESDDDDDANSVHSEFSDTGNHSEGESLDNESLRLIVKTTKEAAKNEKGPESYGYGNWPWEKFMSLLSLSKPMKLDEIKRMCWSQSLLALLERAEDQVREHRRKSEEASTNAKSDSLATAGVIELDGPSGDMPDVEKKAGEQPSKDATEDLLEVNFKSLLSSHESWAEKALSDAVVYAKSAPSRDKGFVQSILDGNRVALDPKKDDGNSLASKVAESFELEIWPALSNRGWQEDKHGKSTTYSYKGQVYKSITSVLDAIPKKHPELTNMANSTISSIAALCKTDAAISKAATLNLDNVTAKALKVFLMDCAPLQLLGDRSRSDRIGLGKKLLSNLSFLDSLFGAAATADANAGPNASEDKKNEELSKLIKMNPRTGLPHPQWTLVHDSILIRAICKHGLIDKRSSADAIGHDTSIHWGSPFEEGATNKSEKPDEEAEKKFNSDLEMLTRVASRASDFVQTHSGNAFEGLKDGKLNEVRQCLIDTYGLAKTGDDDNFVTNKEKLESILRPSKSSAEVEDLPARRPLLKRIRSVVKSINGKQVEEQEETDQAAAVQDSSRAGDETSKPQDDHGFVVLDQADRHNILLVLMMKNQLTFKQSAKVGPKKQLATLILNEFDARIEDLRIIGDDSAISTMSKAKAEFKVYVTNMNKTKNARMAKNVLRVQLGVDPVADKKGLGTNLFPPTGEEEKKSSSVSTAAKGALTKLKQKKAFTSADAALNRALSSIASNDKDGCLRLTSTELLMLTVLSSQGLPVFCEKWDSLIHNSKLEASTSDEDA
ncbi:hypothetical protein THAOC_18377, partial [Thalassiosira oceanica]